MGAGKNNTREQNEDSPYNISMSVKHKFLFNVSFFSIGCSNW